MNISLNEDKTAKPCVFFGILGMFFSLFVLVMFHVYAMSQSQSYGGVPQWYYPDVINQNFLFTFVPFLGLLAIGLVPGLRIK